MFSPFWSSYPGPDPRDCPRDTSESEQLRSGCLGSADQFGHFREASVVSGKLHWVWFWHWLFSVYLPDSFSGNVLSIADDCVASSTSLLRNARKMWELQKQNCPTCRGISLHNPFRSVEGNKVISVVQSGIKA